MRGRREQLALGIVLVRRYVPESPRWLMVRARHPEALVIVAAFCDKNQAYTFEQWAAGPVTIADTLLYLEVARARILEQARA